MIQGDTVVRFAGFDSVILSYQEKKVKRNLVFIFLLQSFT